MNGPHQQHPAQQQQGQPGGQPGTAESRWEPVAAGASLIAVLLLLGYLAYQAWVGQGGPPELHVQVDSTVAAGPFHAVHVRVRNRGEHVAASVRVAGTLQLPDGQEQSEVQFDFVPAGGSRQGVLLFQHDPTSHRPQLRVLGYRQP